MSAPALPAGVQAVNRIGAAARALGVPLLRLDERSLLERAAKNVGHENFGDSRFHQGLQRLTAALAPRSATARTRPRQPSSVGACG